MNHKIKPTILLLSITLLGGLSFLSFKTLSTLSTLWLEPPLKGAEIKESAENLQRPERPLEGRESDAPPQRPRDGDRPPQGEPQKRSSSGVIYPSLNRELEASDFTLTSSAIVNGELLDEFKGEEKINGVEKSIPLQWENLPEGTQSLAIIMYHYPQAEDKSHVSSYLLLWNIDPSVIEIAHGEADDGPWFMGSNKDGNAISYTSPNSPSPGEHIYTISIFALSQPLNNLPQESSLSVDFDTFMSAIEDSEIVGRADLIFKDKKS